MNISQALKVSSLALVVIATASLNLQAEQTKSMPDVPNAKTAVKYGFKAVEKVFPYAFMVWYFANVVPRIDNYIQTKGTEITQKTVDGKEVVTTKERFNIKGVQAAATEMAKCVLAVLCCESIKEDTKTVKGWVSDAYHTVVPA